MQPVPASYVTRLRELGFASPAETVSDIRIGDWEQHGQFYVARMVVNLVNAMEPVERAYWLKCPHDFFYNLDDVIRDRVKTGNELRAGGCHIPRTEWFERGTMIQQEVVGRLVPSDRDTPEWARRAVAREKELYAAAGYQYMDGSGGNFIIDSECNAWCIDLDFSSL